MGFFSELKADIREIERDDCIYSEPEGTEKESKRNPLIIDGVKLIGLSEQIDKAGKFLSEFECYDNLPAIIVVYGPEESGKSLLSKSIMQDNGIRYTLIHLDAVEQSDNPEKLFNSLIHTSEGIILEGYDELKNKKLFKSVNEFLSKSTCIKHKYDETYVSTVIITERRVKIPYSILRRSYTIQISYSIWDLERFFITFCSEFGKDLPDLNFRFDINILKTVFRELNSNVFLLKMWVLGLISISDEERYHLVIHKNILRHLIPNLVNLGRSLYEKEKEEES